jgi:hypothetical protein
VTETIHPQHAASAHSRSALGRLVLLLEVGDGTEKVTYERRWADAEAARHWCEEKIRQAPEGTAVVEIQVTEEFWGRQHRWEATASRHIPETLQLGMRSRTGDITWGAAHQVGNDLGRRAGG